MKSHLSLPALPLLLAARLLVGQEAAPPAPQPQPQYDEPVWAPSLGGALERARAMKNGRVFVELRDAQCPECDRMGKLVYPAASFRAFVKDKVPVRVIRETEDGRRLAGRFAVSKSPAWLVFTPDLLLSGKQEGASNQSTWFERFLETERAWAAFRRKVDEEKAKPSDSALAFAVGEEAFRRFGDAMAEERFRRVSSDEKAPPELREKSLVFLATIALDARRLDDAEKALKKVLATTKDPGLAERVELRLIDVEIGRGGRKSAAAHLKRFIESHPGSPMRPQAEGILKALEGAKPTDTK